MIPIFMRSVMPHLTRGVIRSARSVSSCRAPSGHWFERLLGHPIAWIVIGCVSIASGIKTEQRDALIRETHDLAREARDALARDAGESKLDN